MTGINDLLSDKGWKAAVTAFYGAADPAQPNKRICKVCKTTIYYVIMMIIMLKSVYENKKKKLFVIFHSQTGTGTLGKITPSSLREGKILRSLVKK